MLGAPKTWSKKRGFHECMYDQFEIFAKGHDEMMLALSTIDLSLLCILFLASRVSL